MAQPVPYERQTSFTDFQTANPASPLPGGYVDIEFNSLKQTLDQILENLALLQRDDGALANETVGADQLKAEIAFGLNTVVDWGVGVDYIENDGVWYQGILYRCIESHTSTVFATDLGAGRWSVLVDIATVAQGFIDNAAAEADAAEASAMAAANSQTAAAASETAAANYGTMLSGTSATSVAIGTGAKSFTTQAGKFFAVGQNIKIVSRANPSNYMQGASTTYSGTGLTVNVTSTGGSGTFTDWDILVTGAAGATGPAGSPGAGTGDVVAANNGSEFTNKATLRTNIGLGSGDAVTHNTLALNATTNQIVLDADTTNKLTLTMAALTAARTITFPDKTGTVAMTSDVTTAQTAAQSYTDTQVAATLVTANAYTDSELAGISFPVSSVAGKTGVVTLVKGDVGLGNVANVDTTDAANIASGTLGTARLGSGTASATTFLRGDQTWAAPGLVSSGAIGSYAIARVGGTTVSDNGTAQGSSLSAMRWVGSVLTAGAALSGTWRNMAANALANNDTGLFQRIS